MAYVANLKKNLKKEDLENVFENVKNIRMIKDRESGKFRGFAFVEFENKNSFDEALQVNHILLYITKFFVCALHIRLMSFKSKQLLSKYVVCVLNLFCYVFASRKMVQI